MLIYLKSFPCSRSLTVSSQAGLGPAPLMTVRDPTACRVTQGKRRAPVLHIHMSRTLLSSPFRSGSSQVPQGLSMAPPPLPTQVDQVDSKIKVIG